jgi:hypothetical protein
MTLGFMACKSGSNTDLATGGTNGGDTTGGSELDNPTGTISVAVTGVSDTCTNKIYAVHFNNFDDRSQGQQQIKLNCSAGIPNDCTGDLEVSSSDSNEAVTVYVYCDLSRAPGYYDIDPKRITRDEVTYTNEAQFNACPRTMNVVSERTGTYPTDPGANGASADIEGLGNTNGTPGTGPTFEPTEIFPGDGYDYFKPDFPGLMLRGEGQLEFMAATDIFTVILAKAGSAAPAIAFSDLQPLRQELLNHPSAGGSLGSWCNCILGENVHYFRGANPYFPQDITTPYPQVFFKFPYIQVSANSNYQQYFFVGYFTDTERLLVDNVGRCVLP